MRLLHFFSLIWACFVVFPTNAQSFNYSFSQDSASFQSLSSPTSLNNNTDWSYQHYTLPIGFSFNYLGQSFDTIRVETNGYFLFGNDTRYGLVCFNGIECAADSLGQFSPVGYQLSGSNGARIFKIEFKEVRIMGGSFDNARLTYQVWLHEQGNAIEVHVGNNDYWQDTSITPLVGLFNLQQDTDPVGYLLSGDPSLPATNLIAMFGNLVYLNSVPAPGKIYTLTPSSN